MQNSKNFVSLIFGTIGGFLSYIFGGFDYILICLLWFSVVDYITGVLNALYNKNLDSDVGLRGIIKKVAIYLVVSLSTFLENMGIPGIREMVILFFISNEGISILENLSLLNIKFPEQLREVLARIEKYEMKQEIKQEIKEEIKDEIESDTKNDNDSKIEGEI